MVWVSVLDCLTGTTGLSGPAAEGAKHAGTVAISRIGDPDTGDFGEIQIHAIFGEVDRNMVGGSAMGVTGRPASCGRCPRCGRSSAIG